VQEQESLKYKKLLKYLLIFQTLFYVLFRILDKSHQTWDSAGHIALAIKFSQLYKTLLTDPGNSIYTILTTSFYYPPLMHMLIAPLSLLFGKSSLVFLIPIFLLFLLSIYLTYKIIVLLKFSPKLAFLTSFFYSLFPIVADQARLFHIEIPMLVLILLGCILLIKSDSLKNSKHIYLFFVVLGLGQLLRWFTALFLLVPFLYVLHNAVFVQKRFKEILPKLLLGSVIFFAVWIPWYFPNFKLMRLVGGWFAEGEADDPQVLLSLENIFFYLRSFFDTTVFLIPMLGVFVGTYMLLKNNRKLFFWLSLNFGLLYIVFTCIQNKNSRYLIAFLIPFAFLISYGVTKIKRKAYTLVLVPFIFIGFLFTSFTSTEPLSSQSKFWGTLLTGPFRIELYKLPKMYAYSSTKNPVEEVLNYIYTDAKAQNINPVGVVSLIDQVTMSSSTQELVRLQIGLDDMYFATPYFKKAPFESNYSLMTYYRNKDVSYVIVPKSGVGPDNLRHYDVLVRGVDFMASAENVWYEPIKTIDLEDNQVVIYRRRVFNPEFPVGTCRNFYQVPGGNLTLPVAPLSSLVFFTGSFEYLGVRKDFDPETLQVLEVSNLSGDPKLSLVTVSNLPQEGFTVCHRMGNELKVQKEFYLALLSDATSCGTGICKYLDHTKVSPDVIEQKLYSLADFIGEDTGERVLKALKALPLYEEVYTLKNDIIYEFADK